MVKIKSKTLKHRKLSVKNKTRRVIYGGEAIDSGGYGCVFKPAMKCKTIYSNVITKTSSPMNSNKYVSKLMSKEHADEEFGILQKIAKIITNSGKMGMFRFMVLSGITLCSVTPTQDDLNEYNTKCSRLVEKNGTNSISKLVSLNIPYAGKNLLKMINELRIRNTILNKRIVIQYFQGMRRLFQGGLFLLYETTPKIIHGDLKEENMLCQYNETITDIYDEIKLIDWGLSFTYDIGNPQQALVNISRRPLQFNLPFGVLLFSEYFYREYTKLVLVPLKSNPGNLVPLVRQFCDKYYDDSFFKEGKDDSKPDSLKDFNEYVYNVMGHANNSIFRISLTSFIRINLSKILIKYTRNGIFDKQAYAYEYYLPMLDTYSFILTYGNVLSYLLHARTHPSPLVNNSNLTKLILFITNQLQIYCLNFDEKINGNIYRRRVSQSINQMTNLCVELLK